MRRRRGGVGNDPAGRRRRRRAEEKTATTTTSDSAAEDRAASLTVVILSASALCGIASFVRLLAITLFSSASLVRWARPKWNTNSFVFFLIGRKVK